MTLYAAAKHADVIKGAIAINAPVQISSPDPSPALDTAVPEMTGVGSDIKDPNSKELAYGAARRDPAPDLRALRRHAGSAAAHQVPDALDALARTTSTTRATARTRAADRHLAGRARLARELYHVATIDNDKAEIFSAPQPSSNRSPGAERSLNGRDGKAVPTLKCTHPYSNQVPLQDR
jgi:hypothetical protein